MGLVVRGNLPFFEVLISRTLGYSENFGQTLRDVSLFPTTWPGSVLQTVSPCSSAASHSGLLLGFLLAALPMAVAAGCDAAGNSAGALSGQCQHPGLLLLGWGLPHSSLVFAGSGEN